MRFRAWRSRADWLPYIAWGGLVAIWAALGTATWATWPDLDVDCGRDAYLAARLAGRLPGGAVMLYRDVQYQFGPLTPYWHALLFRLFGVHLAILYACGLLVALGIALVSYAIARRLLSPPLDWLAAAAVLVVFAFRPTLFNYIYPYTFAANYGLLLLALAIWLALRRLETAPQPEWTLWGVGTAVGLCLLDKQEFGLAAIALALLLLLFFPEARQGLSRRRAWLAVLLPATLLPGTVYGYFLLRMGWHQLANENLLPWYLLRNQRIFYQYMEVWHLHRSWFVFWWRLKQWWIPSLLWITGIAWLLRGLEHWRQRPLTRAVACLCLLVYPLWLWQQQWGRELSWEIFDFYYWPLNLLLLAGLAVLRLRRHWKLKQKTLLLLLATGTVLLSRTPGNMSFNYYLNLLFWPTSLAWIYLVWEAIPAAMTRGLKAEADRTEWRKSMQIALATLLALVIAAYARQDLQFSGSKDFGVHAAAGSIYASRIRGKVMQQTLHYLQRHPSPTLLAIPESAFLYVLTDRVTPLPYDHLIPGYISGPRHERQAIQMMRLARPMEIVIVQRDFPEYFQHRLEKQHVFGQAFDHHFYAWILDHYRLARQYSVNGYYWAHIYRLHRRYRRKQPVTLARIPWD